MGNVDRWMSARKFREATEKGAIAPEERVGVHVGFNAKTAVLKEEDEPDTRQMQFSISSQAVDRDGDTVAVEGWDLKNYRDNPVVLFGHDYWNNEAPVVGKSLSEFVHDGRLKSMMEFTPKGTTKLADTLHDLYSKGFMHATSVGFIARDFDLVEDDPGRPFGIDFTSQELVEYSLVPVPSNPEAMSETFAEARQKGVDTGPLFDWTGEIMDLWKAHKSQNFWLPKSTLREIRKGTDPKQATSFQVGGLCKVDAAKAEEKMQAFIEGLKPEQARGVIDSLVGISVGGDPGTAFRLPNQTYHYVGQCEGRPIAYSLVVSQDFRFADAHIAQLEEKAKPDDPEPKRVENASLLLPCPDCDKTVELRMVGMEIREDGTPITDQPVWQGEVDCSCGAELRFDEPGICLVLREQEPDPEVVDDESAPGTVSISDEWRGLCKIIGIDYESLTTEVPVVDPDDDLLTNLESIEVVDEDGTRRGLRSYLTNEALPESIDGGIKAAIDKVFSQ